MLNDVIKKLQDKTMLVLLLGPVKLFAELYDIKIPDPTWDTIVNGLAAIFTVIAIFRSHGKAPESIIPVNPDSPDKATD